MANLAIKPTSYSALAAKILQENLVLPQIGARMFQNPTDSFKVWVAGDEAMVDYVPGVAATATDPAGAYVDINNPKDKAIYKLIDKNQLRKVYNPVDHIDQLVVKTLQAAAGQVDTDVMVALVAGGTTVASVTPTALLIDDQIIALEAAMNTAKAPLEGRFLIVSPANAAFIEKVMVLQTAFGDNIQTNGFKTIGAAHGFNILMSLRVPTGTEMIAVHQDAFGGNYEEIEPIQLVEVPRGNGTIGAWAVDGRIAYNYDVLRATLVQLQKTTV